MISLSLQRFIKRNRKRNRHLYETDAQEGHDYVVCPLSGERLSMIKRSYIERVLGMSVETYTERYPNLQRIATARKHNIAAGLRRVDEETGLTKHAISVQKSNISRSRIGEDGLSVYQRKGQKTRATHMARKDQDGLNGYAQIARKRNETVLPNGRTVQQEACNKGHRTKIERYGSRRLAGASKISKAALWGVLEYLNCAGLHYYFDQNEYGLNTPHGYFFYDLVIPRLELAIEFQGKNFHPNPVWDLERWNSWRQTFTGKTADEIHARDVCKARALYEQRGFQTWWVYEENLGDQVCLFNHISHQVLRNPPKNFAPNDEWEILTPTGWQDFSGTLKQIAPKILDVQTTRGAIGCTPDHEFFVEGIPIRAGDLTPGMFLDADGPPVMVQSAEPQQSSVVYDIVESGDTRHRFLTNGVHTKNCDEFAFVQPRIAEDFWAAISPTLSGGGKCFITSTPNSDADTFAQIWRDASNTFDHYGNDVGIGRNNFKGIKVTWERHPERDEAWADEQRSKVGEQKFRREHNVEFITSEDTLINGICLANLSGIDPVNRINQVRWYKDVNPRSTYLVGLDPSSGVQNDFSAIQVYELPSMEQVAEWQHNETDVRGQVATLLGVLHHLYKTIKAAGVEPDLYWTYEANGGYGDAAQVVIQDTGEEHFPGEPVHEPLRRGLKRIRRGLYTTGKNKIAACIRLKSLVETGRIKLKSKSLVRELKFFVAKGQSFEAKSGEHDDLVTSTLLVVRMMEIIQRWDPNFSEDLREAVDYDGDLMEPMPIAVLI